LAPRQQGAGVDANSVDAEVVGSALVVVQVSVHSLQHGALGQAVLVANFKQLGAGVVLTLEPLPSGHEQHKPDPDLASRGHVEGAAQAEDVLGNLVAAEVSARARSNRRERKQCRSCSYHQRKVANVQVSSVAKVTDTAL
jgi:hypothetical protein